MTKPQLPFVNGKYDIPCIIEQLKSGALFEENSVFQLIDRTQEILRQEPNVVTVKGECCVFGDLHGQFLDFVLQLDHEKVRSVSQKVFLGDYVDRGKTSIEILVILLCMKYNDPYNVVLLRGNHEDREMTKKYGFESECLSKYNTAMYEKTSDFFHVLLIGAIVETKTGRYFLVHGGISPLTQTLQDIEEIDRFQEICDTSDFFCDEAFGDLVWSDPIPKTYLSTGWEEIKFIQNRERDCSVYYGFAAVDPFLKKNGLVGIIRGHQAIAEGFSSSNLGDKNRKSPMVCTVFGSPGYNKRGDKAAVVVLSDEGISPLFFN